MDFTPNPEEELIRETARSIAANYDDTYWIENQESPDFPEEFWTELAEAGFLGVNVPEEYGGEGMGMYEMSVIIEELAANGVMDAGMLFVLTMLTSGRPKPSPKLAYHPVFVPKEEFEPHVEVVST